MFVALDRCRIHSARHTLEVFPTLTWLPIQPSMPAAVVDTRPAHNTPQSTSLRTRKNSTRAGLYLAMSQSSMKKGFGEEKRKKKKKLIQGHVRMTYVQWESVGIHPVWLQHPIRFTKFAWHLRFILDPSVFDSSWGRRSNWGPILSRSMW